jgi:glycerol-3-phosphate acyltransferase PlsY
MAGVVAMLGHICPVWLGFRGGKGVATGVGVFVVLAPLAVVFSGMLFMIIVWSTRYVSLGSISGALSIPLFALLLGARTPVIVSALLAAVLIVFAHRANIRRLLSHTENKFK